MADAVTLAPSTAPTSPVPYRQQQTMTADIATLAGLHSSTGKWHRLFWADGEMTVDGGQPLPVDLSGAQGGGSGSGRDQTNVQGGALPPG